MHGSDRLGGSQLLTRESTPRVVSLGYFAPPRIQAASFFASASESWVRGAWASSNGRGLHRMDHVAERCVERSQMRTSRHDPRAPRLHCLFTALSAGSSGLPAKCNGLVIGVPKISARHSAGRGIQGSIFAEHAHCQRGKNFAQSKLRMAAGARFAAQAAAATHPRHKPSATRAA